MNITRTATDEIITDIIIITSKQVDSKINITAMIVNYFVFYDNIVSAFPDFNTSTVVADIVSYYNIVTSVGKNNSIEFVINYYIRVYALDLHKPANIK